MNQMHSYEEIVKECLRLEKDGAKAETIGLSKHGNKIPLVTVGAGTKRVLVVCRQHGNEPTSTEAMLEYMEETLAKKNKEETKLFVIPVANPDGAKIFKHLCRKNKTSLLISYAARSNRLFIGDINRDHKKRKTPEAQAIFDTVKRIRPHLILDLHNFFPAYRYVALQRAFHDFCPLYSMHPKIKSRIKKVCCELCKVSMEAVRRAGGKPMKINGLQSIDMKLMARHEGILEAYYPLYLDIPSLTLEVLGGFNLCSRRIGMGKKLHKAAVDAILEAFASMKP